MTPTSNRNESLDVLRCIAVLLVVGYHLPYYRLWSRIGWIGVDLFFVLSGFLISGLLFQEYKDTGNLNIKRFLIRRGLKIYPSYYLLMVAVTIFFLLNRSTTTKVHLVASWFFIQNYFPAEKVFIILSHTWSLAVEEHFYLFLPVMLIGQIIVFPKRDPFRLIPFLFLVIAATCLAFRCFGLWPLELAWMTHMRIDSLFAGVTLGYLYHFRRRFFDRLTGHYALPLGLALCVPATLFEAHDRRVQTFGLSALFVGFSFLVAWAVVRTPRNPIGRVITRVAARIGFYSYSIYLWHMVVVFAFGYYPASSATKFWTYLATTVFLGITMAQLVEMPYLALRDRVFPTPHVTPPSPTEVDDFSAVSARSA
jgi:peptidoglycan/LPS O-acetylase OafA/YrhL